MTTNPLAFGDWRPFMVCIAESADGEICGKPYEHEGAHWWGDNRQTLTISGFWDEDIPSELLQP